MYYYCSDSTSRDYIEFYIIYACEYVIIILLLWFIKPYQLPRVAIIAVFLHSATGPVLDPDIL